MATKFISGEGRFSFVQLFTARAMEAKPGEAQQEPQYSTNFMIPKTDVAQYEALVKAMQQEFDESKAKKNKNSIPDRLQFDDFKKGWWKNPLKDGDAYADEQMAKKNVDRPEYRGMWFFQASKKESDGQPQISEIKNRELIPLTDKADFYSGCWGRISFNIASFNHPSGGPGLSFYINSVVKTKDDTAFAATTSKAEVDFADLIDQSDFLN